MTSPLQAIRAHCLHCSAGQPGEVRLCPVTRCNLHPFRFGRKPQESRRELTAEARAALTARLRGGQSVSPDFQGGTDAGSDVSSGEALA